MSGNNVGTRCFSFFLKIVYLMSLYLDYIFFILLVCQVKPASLIWISNDCLNKFQFHWFMDYDILITILDDWLLMILWFYENHQTNSRSVNVFAFLFFFFWLLQWSSGAWRIALSLKV